jgi:hypothetical protein
MLEAHPFSGQAIQAGRLDIPIAIAAQRPLRMVIRQYKAMMHYSTLRLTTLRTITLRCFTG